MENVQNSICKLRQISEGLFNDYTNWIKNKPGHASDIETSVKVFSYFLHGRCKSSSVLPEILYCASNLLSFWHDTLLKAEAERLMSLRPNSASTSAAVGTGNNLGAIGESSGSTSAGTMSNPATNAKRIKTALTILEYFEVFLEVGAKHLFGDAGKWLVILVVQALKAALRLTLLVHFKVGLIESPAIQPFDRKNHFVDKATGQMNPSFIFILRHSGRVVRKIKASPSLSARSWKLPSAPVSMVHQQNDLPPVRLLSEVLHIMRPLCHLTGLGIWGTNSWKPWLTSIAIDVASLQLHGKPDSNMTTSEKIELTRRTYALLYYLIRSPFYDRFTRHRILTSLVMFSSKIPIVGNLCAMLAEAIPEWQQTYSYSWGDI